MNTISHPSFARLVNTGRLDAMTADAGLVFFVDPEHQANT